MKKKADANLICEKIMVDNLDKVREVISETLASNDLDCLDALYMGLMRRGSSNLARGDIRAFIDFFFRLEVEIKRADFPKAWRGEKAARHDGLFSALSRLAIATSEIMPNSEVLEYIKKPASATVMKILRESTWTKGSELLCKVGDMNKAGLEKVLDELCRTSLIKVHGSKEEGWLNCNYELTFLGNELALTM